METDGRRMCEVLVGLGEVDLVGVEELPGDRLRVTIRSRGSRPVCGGCGGRVWSKGDRLVRLVDLPAFGRPVRLRWRKRRWVCPDVMCGVGSSCGTGPVGGAGTGLVDLSRRSLGHRSGGSVWSHGVGGGRRVGL
ncbi:MAG: transposase family protein [Acidimicrobiia bacterium]|nr:transposase family protein [Acidimicrobiia bacterium]